MSISISKLKSLEKYWTDKKWMTAYKYEAFFRSLPFILSFLSLPIFIFAIILYQARGLITLPIFILLIIISNSYYFKRKNHKKLTEDWAKTLSHILWYREFLVTCDENKLRTFLKEDPLFLDKTLPYATVFGIDSELINKILPIMKDLDINASWYNSDLSSLDYLISWINNYTPSMPSTPLKVWGWSWGSSYSSDSWWDSGSSFDFWWGWFSSWWGGGWWGWRSW